MHVLQENDSLSSQLLLFDEQLQQEKQHRNEEKLSLQQQQMLFSQQISAYRSILQEAVDQVHQKQQETKLQVFQYTEQSYFVAREAAEERMVQETNNNVWVFVFSTKKNLSKSFHNIISQSLSFKRHIQPIARLYVYETKIRVFLYQNFIVRI